MKKEIVLFNAFILAAYIIGSVIWDNPDAFIGNIIVLNAIFTVNRFFYKNVIQRYIITANISVFITFITQWIFAGNFDHHVAGVWLFSLWITITLLFVIQIICSWLIIIKKNKFPLPYFLHELKIISLCGFASIMLAMILATIM